MQPQPDRTGILIVHLWHEQGVRLGLRARITQSLDSMHPEPVTAAAASPDDIYALVKTWVEEFVALSAPDRP